MIWACRGGNEIGRGDKESLQVGNTASDEKRCVDSGWKVKKGTRWVWRGQPPGYIEHMGKGVSSKEQSKRRNMKIKSLGFLA